MTRQASLKRQPAASAAVDPAGAMFDSIAEVLVGGRHAAGGPPRSPRPRTKARGRRVDDSPLQIILRVLASAGLPDALALDYARLICQEFTGEQIYFAAVDWYSREALAALMFDDHRAGVPIRQLAARYGRGVATVHALLREERDRRAARG